MNTFRLSLACAALAVAASAQLPEKLEIPEGLAPFRNPIEHVEPPRDLFRDLQLMHDLAEKHGVHYDASGIEVCDHPDWQRVRDGLDAKMFNMATMFGIILRDSRHVNDRRLAAYGTFYCGDPESIVRLIAFFPGEPERSIRQEAYRRAIKFLEVHLPQNREPEEATSGAVAPPRLPRGPRPSVAAGPSRPERAVPKYSLEIAGYLGLLHLDDVRDQAQGLWFLTQIARIRADGNEVILHYTKDRLRSFVVAKDDLVRKHARELLFRLDPKHRKVPEDDAPDKKVIAWLDAILYDVFPPIRHVSTGRTDLYPSDDLDAIVAKGRDLLERDALGETVEGKMSSGLYYRGVHVARTPEPLDKLRIPTGAVIISINGQPTPTCKSLLEQIELHAKVRAPLMVEYVLNGQPQIMEFRFGK